MTANTVLAGLSGEMFATVDRALDERTIGHNPERLCLMKVVQHAVILDTAFPKRLFSEVFAAGAVLGRAFTCSNLTET